MKSIFLSALALAMIMPASAAAQTEGAEEAEARRFEHDGRVYSYTVTETDRYRVIRGVEEKTGKSFTLRVGPNRVRGTVGSQAVNFALRDVKPLDKAAVLALR